MIEMKSTVAVFPLMANAIQGKEEDSYAVLNSMSQREVYDTVLSLARVGARHVVMSAEGDVPRALEVLAEWETVAALDDQITGAQQ